MEPEPDDTLPPAIRKAAQAAVAYLLHEPLRHLGPAPRLDQVNEALVQRSSAAVRAVELWVGRPGTWSQLESLFALLLEAGVDANLVERTRDELRDRADRGEEPHGWAVVGPLLRTGDDLHRAAATTGGEPTPGPKTRRRLPAGRGPRRRQFTLNERPVP